MLLLNVFSQIVLPAVCFVALRTFERLFSRVRRQVSCHVVLGDELVAQSAYVALGVPPLMTRKLKSGRKALLANTTLSSSFTLSVQATHVCSQSYFIRENFLTQIALKMSTSRMCVHVHL